MGIRGILRLTPSGNLGSKVVNLTPAQSWNEKVPKTYFWFTGLVEDVFRGSSLAGEVVELAGDLKGGLRWR